MVAGSLYLRRRERKNSHTAARNLLDFGHWSPPHSRQKSWILVSCLMLVQLPQGLGFTVALTDSLNRSGKKKPNQKKQQQHKTSPENKKQTKKNQPS